MTSRFRAYSADANTTFDYAFWNRVMQELDARILGIEEKKADFEEAERQLIEVALRRINETIQPAAERIHALSTLGFLVASSDDSVKPEAGQQLTIIVREGDERELFAPSPFLALTRQSTVDDYAIARRVAYAKETGQLLVEVLATFGNMGPHDDWEICALAGSTMAQLEMLADAQAIQDDIIEKHAAVTGAAEVIEAAVSVIETGPVISVAGKTGTVTLGPEDVGAAPSTHSHEISDVDGLADALSGKAPSTHSHEVSEVTGLQDALDGKQATSAKGQPNGYAPLDSGGKVPTANLPSLGGFTLLQTVSLSSAAAAIDFTGLTDDYAAYVFVLDRVYPSTGISILNLRTSSNNGSSFNSGSTDYEFATVLLASNSNSVSGHSEADASEIYLADADSTPAQSEGVSGEIIFHRNSGRIELRATSVVDGVLRATTGWGRRKSGTPNAIRFFWSSGNHASGSVIRCYGVAK